MIVIVLYFKFDNISIEFYTYIVTSYENTRSLQILLNGSYGYVLQREGLQKNKTNRAR